MERTKVAKIVSLILSSLIFCLLLTDVTDWANVGIYKNCNVACRLSYSFFHANLLHALLNVWCFLSVVFFFNVSIYRLLLSFLVATTIPTFLLSTTATIGLSAVVYFLFGSISFSVKDKLRYHFWIFLYIAIGFFAPNTNAIIHLYCYLVGVVFAFLNNLKTRKNER